MTSLSFTAVCMRRTLDWSLQITWLIMDPTPGQPPQAYLPPSHLSPHAWIRLGSFLLHSRLNMHQFPEVVRRVAGVPGLRGDVLVPGPCHLDLVSPSCRLILLIRVQALQPQG